ncbi:MAG TPA: hypothetical protein VKB41_15065 [Steroidobacteraceae bacterium]|jgi:hypothetical protein|nr:hypothetical protein [Steroidobacteraceae bacterium]
MQQQFPGRFDIESGAHAGVLRMERRAGREGAALALLFAGVSSHNLPARLEGVSVDDAPSNGGFSVRSGEVNYRVAARSVQIHEAAKIYDRALPLARFRFSQRLSWSVLLWCARFSWGQNLIRRLRGG